MQSSLFRPLILSLALLTTSIATADGKANDPVAALREMLAQPDAQIDFARAKLTFDRFIDPAIDLSASLKQIDTMADTARRMAGSNAPPLRKLRAVREYIYVDGDWNGNRSFQYDLSDPLGEKPANRLLSTYLKTRRGNCISMPILFLALADRLGLHVTLSTAPMHEFVKYVDDPTRKAYNLETTSGALPARDAWYRQKLPMTDEAIKNGLYLKTLTRKQSVAVMAEPLIEHYRNAGDYGTAIALSDLVLNEYPEFPIALLKRGNAYQGLIDSEFQAKYPQPHRHSEESAAEISRVPSRTRYVLRQSLGLGLASGGWGTKGEASGKVKGVAMRRIIVSAAAALLFASVSAQARFLQTDPVGYGPDLNLYTYVGNDPVDRTDPRGEMDDYTFDIYANAVSQMSPQEQAGLAIVGAIATAGAIGVIAAVEGGAGATTAGAIAAGGGVGAKGLAPLTKAERMSANAAQGRAGQAATEAKLGDKVAGKEVSFRTSDQTRTRADFVTKDKAIVETKTGNAQLSKGQQKLHDDIKAGREVTPIGQNAAKAGLEPGKPTTMTSCLVDRTC